MWTAPAWLAVTWLMRLPCMPVELGSQEPLPLVAPRQAPPLPPAARLPGAPPSRLPAPLAMVERLRYRVDFGPLQIGRIQLLTGGSLGAGSQIVSAAGHGEGAILGFGRLENHVVADFDAQRLSSRLWTNARRDNDGVNFIRDL